MLQHKDTISISEIKARFNAQTYLSESFLEWLSFFKFNSVYSPLEVLKTKGYLIADLLSILIILPFINKGSVHALLKSGMKDLSPSAKDSYYRLKNMETIAWEKLLGKFVKRFLFLVAKNTAPVKNGPRYLILDDTLLPKRGKVMEGVSRLWNHVTHRSELGYRLLQLGLYDGKSFLPLNFSFHREKGKNKEKPYGLTRQESKDQYNKCRAKGSPGARRVDILDASKIETGIKMITKACKKLQISYLLMDSWFTCQRMLECAKDANVHLIGMMKMGNANYSYKGTELNSGELLQRLCKKSKRCRKLKSNYIQVEVVYKGFPVKLFFSRFGKRAKWHLILTTDLSLDYLTMMRHYQVRWTIEVYFKESKQYLNLGKCQSEDLDAQAADATIAMIQYILLSLNKRFGDYETKGELFRHAEQTIQDLTLQSRIWGLLIELVQAIIELMELDINDMDEFMNRLINTEKINPLLQKTEPHIKAA
ncbi:MAG: transposase [Bacteroidetes bacterium]|nr:transposase [Bacteroidota bacterium]